MDVIKILETLQSHGLVRLGKQTGNWYQVYCPFHNNGQERRPSCGVSLVSQFRGGSEYPEGLWHCFACQSSYDMESGVTEILHNHGLDVSGRSWLSQNVSGYEIVEEDDSLISSDILESVSNLYAIQQIKSQSDPVQYVSEEELASYRYTVPYMYERHLTDEIIEKYDVGFDANWIPPGRTKKVPCITFPVHDQEGRTLFFCRRSIQGKMYNYPQGVTKPVYGLDKIPPRCKSVLICESIINALTAETWGYDAVALMGTGNTYQMNQLKQLGVSEFVLALDGDDAGRSAARKIQNALRSVAIIWTIDMPDGKDVNDVDQETFKELYNNRR